MSADNNIPWVSFYPEQWLAGTSGMTPFERGIYITLIMLMYNKKEPIALNVKKLSRICGASIEEFSEALEELINDNKIIQLEDGSLWNNKVSKELNISNANPSGGDDYE
ncbi:DUF1376 domain-containing protein [Bartonella sp. DGB1]|uniref:DUF1376 domain-containing protein n=1 Tax=Bartonella sp. DGB1 TaxID=3239807 RepID=UPI0035234506